MTRLDLNDIKAVMLGHAVGDALGVPVEFCKREELDENPVKEMLGWGTYPVPKGCWSDDTSMSLAALDSLKNCKVDFEEIMDNFVAWCTEDKYTPTGEMFDIGKTCMTAIRNYLKGNSSALKCGLDDERSNGNGSLMRIHPFVLYSYANDLPFEKMIDLINEASSITHAHERSRVGCLIYAFALWHILSDHSISALNNGLARAEAHLKDYTELSHYSRIFYENFASTNRDKIKSSGYVVDTLEAAIWCVLTTNDYKSCVLKAVNLGGDTDTVAAIAGGLAGALYGFHGISKDWINKLKKKDYIEKMCEEACKTWKNVI